MVVGTESEQARKVMERLYRPFMVVSDRMIFTDIPSAEMIKYAANSMLATRISFMNDIANLCELVGADVNMVRKGIGSDTRIGKEIPVCRMRLRRLMLPERREGPHQVCRTGGLRYARSACRRRGERRPERGAFQKLLRHFGGSLKGKRVALWGLAFKPETDDMREAPALVLIDRLKSGGADVRVFDPVAMDECRRRLGDAVEYASDMYDAAVDADALLLVTEWKQFRIPSLPVLKRTMRRPLIIDGRNIYDPEYMKEAGFTYDKIG